MPITAGSPIVAADFITQMDDNTADIATLQGQMTATQAATTILFEREQSDTVADTTSLGGDISVVFSPAFSSTPVVNVTPSDVSNGYFTVMVHSKTTTGFEVRCFDGAGAVITSTALQFDWHATLA